jgi:hypothetical protein
MIKVSKMSGKLSGIAGINTNSLSNLFCQKMEKGGSICKWCYSCSMLRGLRKNCIPAWESNSIELSTKELSNSDIPKIDANIVRFHAHGELINRTHFRNFLKIAKAYPEKRFALFTKRIHLTKGEDIPKNVTMVFSNPQMDQILEKPPQGFDKVFNVVTVESERVNCGAKSCIDCQKCFHKNGTKVIIEKIKTKRYS